MDIETLSTQVDATVLSIGICLFDDEKEQPFLDIVANGLELFFERKCAQKNRHVMPSTVQWWEEQGEEARRCLYPEEVIDPREFHTYLQAFCDKNELNYNWLLRDCRWFTRGPHFDIAIMDSLFSEFNITSPWKYFKVRDIRTWLECHGLPDNLKLNEPEGMIAHNALHDAAFDAWMMQQVLVHSTEDLDVADRKRKQSYSF